ncbi:hypothetical protein IGI04_002786 [Brassica rapa subsp. trilocularis]|uniref:Uncharacterized protein n=1 Tax=Brassica rapa subsp. trilocularis TaxID=1813537 RepID=A0ABQ7NWH0_BRACM|nr:hypothetical protein IGI04_002786 [Brassica rapa subsp. trilocularis]
MDSFGPFYDLSVFVIYRTSAYKTTSIPKKVRTSRIAEAARVPTMTPIEMKQEQVRSNPEVGSYENGTRAGYPFGLSRRTGELDSAFGPTRPFCELDGVFGLDDRAL